LLGAGLLPWRGAAQAVSDAPEGGQLQVGPALIPGFGLQLGYVSLRSFYTREVMSFVDFSPSYGGGEGSVEVAAGFGGALRINGLLRNFGSRTYQGYDIDVGLRLLPGLVFALKESREAKNQRFNLSLEPFLRVSTRVSSGRVFFAEIGTQRPLLRAGLWIGL
jgi:hypothetical protein